MPDHTTDSELEARLHEARAVPDDGELSRIRARALRDADRRRGARGRAGLVGLLTAGMLMSAGGATLAIDGVASRQDASVAQYGTQNVKPANGATRADTDPPAAPTIGQGTPVFETPARGVAAETVDATGQIAQGGQELPFTGYAGFTVLLLGFALLSAGLILRRRTGEERR